MNTRYEIRLRTPALVFSVEDAFAGALSGKWAHPPPIAPLTFWLKVSSRESLEMVMQRNASGYYLFFGLVRNPDGSTRRHGLPPGTYNVEIHTGSGPRNAALYQVPPIQVELPVDPHRVIDVKLNPGPIYPFPNITPLRLPYPLPKEHPTCADWRVPGQTGLALVRGSLFARDGGPRRDVPVSAGTAGRTDRSSSVTGPEGDWVLVFPPDPTTDPWPVGPVIVRFELPNAPNPPQMVDVPDVCVLPGYETSLQQTAARGRIQDANGRPRPGVPLSLVVLDRNGANIMTPPDPPVTRADGTWVYYFDHNQPPNAAQTLVITVQDADGNPIESSVPLMLRATVVAPTIRF